MMSTRNDANPMELLEMFDNRNLNAALAGIGAATSTRLFEDLHAVYTAPDRHYHTEAHVAECIRQTRRFGHLALLVHEIETAIWFHDAVYDTRRSDNEEKSAEWAQRELALLSTPNEVIDRIVDMILSTKSHTSTSPDTILMVDIDLGVLGATPAHFEIYDQAIRREFAWVPVADYRTGRSRVLTAFLERPVIFGTEEIRHLYEARARENLRKKIDELAD